MQLRSLAAGLLAAALVALLLSAVGAEEVREVAEDEGLRVDDVGSNSLTADAAEYEFPNLYDETMPMLWVSRLSYSFSYILNEARKDTNDLQIPDEIRKEYKDKRLDVRGLNGGHGLSFRQIYQTFIGQVDELKRAKAVSEYDLQVIERLREIEDMTTEDDLFLEVFDSITGVYECVYGIFKDEMRKRIIVAFRGSVTPKDWAMNLSAQLVRMRAPQLLKDETREHVHVHRGFYEYLFDNEHADGDQRYDQILADIRPFVEEGYKLYVTGHSLGAALGSILAFKLAGKTEDWIPKPIMCITFESPFAGGQSFGEGFRQLERDGILRYLRVTNSRDIVPAIPPFSLGLRNKGLYRHVGIRLDLTNSNKYSISYPRAGRMHRMRRSLANTILKPVWSVLHYHALELVDERLVHQRRR